MSFLSIPQHLWKWVFIGQEEDGQWVTIHGTHIFIKEGESIESAIQRTFGITRENRAMAVVGRVGKTQILASANVHPEVVKAVTDTLPKTMGHQLVSEVKIFDSTGRQFEAGGARYTELGHFDPKDYSISLYPGDKRDEAGFIKDIALQHEVAHAVFDKEYNDSLKNRPTMSYEYLYQTLTKYQAVKPVSGEARDISDEALKKINKELKDAGYPPYRKGMDLDEYANKAYDYFQPDINKFVSSTIKEGGVTDYANSWVKQAEEEIKEGKAGWIATYSAGTENFAELAALKAKGGFMYENVKQTHPETVKYFEKIISKYSKG